MRPPTVHIVKRPKLRLAKPILAAAPPSVKTVPKHTNAFYLTPEWRRLVGDLVHQRGRRCEKCGQLRDQDGRPIRVFGDHVIELRDGGALLDPSNVQLLCGSCHAKKSIAERIKRYSIHGAAR
jgi:5-methylcytosine-specific restriction protein A